MARLATLVRAAVVVAAVLALLGERCGAQTVPCGDPADPPCPENAECDGGACVCLEEWTGAVRDFAPELASEAQLLVDGGPAGCQLGSALQMEADEPSKAAFLKTVIEDEIGYDADAPPAGAGCVESLGSVFRIPSSDLPGAPRAVDVEFRLVLDLGSFEFDFGFCSFRGVRELELDTNTTAANRQTFATACVSDALARGWAVFDNEDDSTGATRVVSVPTDYDVVFYLIPNNRTAEFVASPGVFYTDERNLQRPPLFSVSRGNPGQLDHMLYVAYNNQTMLMWEDKQRDISACPTCEITDNDYNDLIFSMDRVFVPNLCGTPLCDPDCVWPGSFCADGGVCQCEPGYTGLPNCTTPECDPPCGGNLECTAPDTCECTLACDNGSVNATDCSCVCDPGYRPTADGAACECDTPCDGGGSVNETTCACECPSPLVLDGAGTACVCPNADECEGGSLNGTDCGCTCPPSSALVNGTCECTTVCADGVVNEACECTCPDAARELSGAGDACVCAAIVCEFGVQNSTTCGCTCPDADKELNLAGDGCECTPAVPCGNGGVVNESACACECPAADRELNLAGDACECVPTPCGNGGAVNASTCECGCPDADRELNLAGDACECVPTPCGNGGVQNPGSCLCQCPDADRELNLAGDACVCVADIACGNGGVVNASTCECGCPDADRTLNLAGDACECVATACGNGGVQNATSCACECPDADRELNLAGDACECVAVSCDAGKSQDAASCECVCDNACTGGTLNATDCSCACPTGQVYNATLDECRDIVCDTVCVGGSVNNVTCACECPSPLVLDGAGTACVCPNADECEGGSLNGTDCGCTCPPSSALVNGTCECTTVCADGVVNEACECTCPDAARELSGTGDACVCAAIVCEFGVQNSTTCGCTCPDSDRTINGTGDGCECLPTQCDNGGEQNSSTCACECPAADRVLNAGGTACVCIPLAGPCGNGGVQNATSCACECPDADRELNLAGDACECVAVSCDAGKSQDAASCECVCDNACTGGTLNATDCSCACPFPWQVYNSTLDECRDIVCDTVCVGGSVNNVTCACECPSPLVLDGAGTACVCPNADECEGGSLNGTDCGCTCPPSSALVNGTCECTTVCADGVVNEACECTCPDAARELSGAGDACVCVNADECAAGPGGTLNETDCTCSCPAGSELVGDTCVCTIACAQGTVTESCGCACPAGRELNLAGNACVCLPVPCENGVQDSATCLCSCPDPDLVLSAAGSSCVCVPTDCLKGGVQEDAPACGCVCEAPNTVLNATSGLCACEELWEGPNCTTPSCTPLCGNGTTCYAGNVCECAPGTGGVGCGSCEDRLTDEVAGGCPLLVTNGTLDCRPPPDELSPYNDTGAFLLLPGWPALVLGSPPQPTYETRDRGDTLEVRAIVRPAGAAEDAGDEGGESYSLVLVLAGYVQAPSLPCQDGNGAPQSGAAFCDASPRKRIADEACYADGGPADTGEWHYFLNATGNLTAADGSGATLGLELSGAAAQIGPGASGVSVCYGMSVALAVDASAWPAGAARAAPDADAGDAELTTSMTTECTAFVVAPIIAGRSEASDAFDFPWWILALPAAALLLAAPLAVVHRAGASALAAALKSGEEDEPEAPKPEAAGEAAIAAAAITLAPEAEAAPVAEAEPAPAPAPAPAPVVPPPVDPMARRLSARNQDLLKTDGAVPTGAPNTYKIAKKTVRVKEVRGQLLVRVGGGFVSYQEFSERYNPSSSRVERAMETAESNMKAGMEERAAAAQRDGFKVNMKPDDPLAAGAGGGAAAAAAAAAAADSDADDDDSAMSSVPATDSEAGLKPPVAPSSAAGDLAAAGDSGPDAAAAAPAAASPGAAAAPVAAADDDDDDEPPKKSKCPCCVMM